MSFWGTLYHKLGGGTAKGLAEPAAAGIVPAEPATGTTGSELPPARYSTEEPEFEECQAEWIRYHNFLAAGNSADPEFAHPDQYVAFFDNRILGYGPDPWELQDRIARDLNIHPARIVIDYPYAY